MAVTILRRLNHPYCATGDCESNVDIQTCVMSWRVFDKYYSNEDGPDDRNMPITTKRASITDTVEPQGTKQIAMVGTVSYKKNEGDWPRTLSSLPNS
jgi:hypothetical protein